MATLENSPGSQSQTVTDFAPAERASREAVHAQYQTFVGTHCRAFFDTLPTVILVLNSHRQVVFANSAAVAFLGATVVEDVLGKRPGEALGCINAQLAPGGCGTSKHCRNCGAVQAILAALEGTEADEDCKLLRREQTILEGLDLHVTATPLILDGAQFVVFAVADISHEQRRRSMERIFFHDVLNLAGGINGLVDMLGTECASGQVHEFKVLHTATQALVDEIVAQREILAAETNELKPCYSQTDVSGILRQLAGLYAPSHLAQGQRIQVEEPDTTLQIETDGRLVHRVLGNMLKNALEAGQVGDTVRLACVDEGEQVCFRVHNDAVLPEEIQENIFHRRFSTKGVSRGLGTYSMLLLTERYLRGSVGFTSTEAEGTTFFLRLPKRLESA